MIVIEVSTPFLVPSGIMVCKFIFRFHTATLCTYFSMIFVEWEVRKFED